MEEAGNVVRKTEPFPARSLRVLLDARKLEDGGIGTYIRNLIRGLKVCEDVALTVLCRPESSARLVNGGGVEIIHEEARPYSMNEFIRMPMRVPFEDFDVFHVPHYTLPFGIRIPTVITVHDLIHIYAPERFYYPYLARPLIRSALRRATRVITVSQASLNQIKKFTHNDPEIERKLFVIPNAVDRALVHFDNGEGARKRDYFLAVFSNSKPHKGLDDLITAFRELRHELVQEGSEPAKRLVLVGPGTGQIKGRSFGSEPGSPGEILAMGEVSSDALRRLYAHAAALIVPSLADGFCLPVLEAHAVGIPVVARPVPAILELTTQFDVTCEDFSIEALKAGIRKFLSNHESLESSAHDLKRQAESFSPETAARAVQAVYIQAAESEGRGVE